MPKPNKFIYEKRETFRDAFYFIIVCEGQNREPDYFRFFDGISSRVKVIAVQNIAGQSSPLQLIENALRKEEELDARSSNDQVWFVIDTDKWRAQIHQLRKECEHHQNWFVSQSNPCFEVWLYYHAKSTKAILHQADKCKTWKQHVHQVITGGFNPDFHPVAIAEAIKNAKANYEETGYLPLVGSTQVWQLAEQLIPVIAKDLEALKDKFPPPLTEE